MSYIELKILYFTSFTLLCSIPNFIPLTYKYIFGFNESDIGILIALIPLMGCIATPLWTNYVDKTQAPFTILSITALGSTFSVFLLYFLSEHFHFIGAFISTFLYAIFFTCIAAIIDGYTMKVLTKQNEHLYGEQRLFGALSCGITGFFTNLILTKSQSYYSLQYIQLGSAVIFISTLFIIWTINTKLRSNNTENSILEYNDIKDLETNQKLDKDLIKSIKKVEKVSYDILKTEEYNDDIGVINNEENEYKDNYDDIVKENIKELKEQESDSNLTIINQEDEMEFHDIPIDDNILNNQNVSITNESPYHKLLNPEAIVLLICSALHGSSFGIVQGFLYLFVTEELKAPKLINGFLGPFDVFLELPFFFFSGSILEKLGIRLSITLSILSMTSRFLLYTIIPTENLAWFILPVELFHGLSYCLFWTAAITYVADITPLGYETSFQGILSGFYSGLGGVIGSLGGGFLFKAFGSRIMFLISAFVELFTLALFLLAGPKSIPSKSLINKSNQNDL